MISYKRNKPRHSLLLILCFGILTLTSCTEDKVYPDPDIEFIREEGFVYSDTTLALTQIFKIGLKMESRSDEILVHYNTTIERDGRVSSSDNAISAKTYETQIGSSKNIGAEVWSFYCRDRDSRKSEVISLTLSLDTSSGYGGIKYIPSIVLGGQSSSEQGSFYSLSEDQVMTLSEAFNSQENVNLAYYYDTLEDDKNTIASPGSNIDVSIFPGPESPSNWAIKNTTRFIKASDVTPIEFEACKNDSLIIANTFDFPTGKRKAKELGAGQIYSFVTNGGQNGMFLVKEVKGDVDGSIEIALKMMNQ